MSQEHLPQDRANILVIDDSLSNLRMLTQMLSDQGYKVYVASEGSRALKSVFLVCPDLILLDIKMPQMDGYEICAQLKADVRTRDIPVIFLSALDEPLDKIQAFEVGGVDYITKPFQLVEVLARVENQLRWRELQLKLKQQNAWLQLLLNATQSISKAPDLESALEVIMTQICETIGWDFAEAWTPNLQDEALTCSPVWYAKTNHCGCVPPALSEFREQSKTLIFTPNMGLPGRVWFTKQSEWIENITAVPDNRYLRRQIAALAEFKLAFAVPIISRKRVLAVLVFYKINWIEPDLHLIDLVNAIATQLGAVIQGKKIEKALKKANLALEHLATLDGLTQVANRRHFDRVLKREWRRLRREQLPLSLILCDVDYFKLYNDTYGHLAGDNCLKQVAGAIGEVVKRPADLLARYGGEEFAVLLPNTDSEGAFNVAELIRQQLQQLNLPHAQSQVSKYITLSLGVSSMIPSHEFSSDILIARSDLALYQAKRKGRDRTILI